MEPVLGEITGGENEVVPAGRVAEFLVRVFESVGTPDFIARVAAEHLVCANLCGCDSHGVIEITDCLNKVKAGVVVPAAMPRIVSRRGAAAVVDAQNGWGLYAGKYATDLAIEMAMSTGIGGVSVRNCNDIGRLGEYVEKDGERGLIGFVLRGPGRPAAWRTAVPGLHMAGPYGGSIKTLGTNSIAVGVPNGDDVPLVAEFRTPVYQDRGQPSPPEVLLDEQELSATSPAEYVGACALPIFVKRKGYGFSLLTCLLGCLTGSYEFHTGDMEGPFFVVIDPGAFWSREGFQAGIRSFLGGMKATPLGARNGGARVLRDIEAPSRAHREVEGIELTPVVQATLRAAAEDCGVPFDLFPDILA